MKRMIKLLTVVAAAAMGLTACQNNFDEQIDVDIKSSVTVNFVSEEARTSVDTSGDTPLFSWNESETFTLLEQTDALAEATSVAYTNVDGKANINAEFPLNLDKGEYKYIAIHPASGFLSAENISAATLALPSEQSMAEESYDANADLMVSMAVTTAAQPTESQMLRFTRLAAVVKMAINNLSLASDETIEGVEFTANGKSLAGSITADLENPHEFTVKAGVSTVAVATTSVSAVYFTVLPATLEAGDTYSVTVVTNKKVYVKQGEIPAEKSLAFEAGKVSRFGVNMTDAVVADKWKLVRDASTLKEGDVVAIVAKDYDKALSTKLYSGASETSTTSKRDVADITKSGNYLVSTTDVQSLILVTGVADNTFSFYDEARKKFLVSTSTSSTHLRNQEYCSADTSFAITIDSATTVATITNTEGERKGNLLRYNSNGYFVSNQNTGSTYKDVCVYRLEGAEGKIPVVDAHITINVDDDECVTIAEEGAQTPASIEEVVFDYVGDWTISVSDNADWLTVAYDATKNCLTYTADANTDTKKRNAVVTISATREDKTLTFGPFNVEQKGAPEEITCDALNDKEKNVDVTYKLTGKIVSMTSTSSGTFMLDDGSGRQAKITYLFTDENKKVYDNTDIGLAVGDVVTVTTIVYTKGYGGNGSYHSIYKGHYSIAATASGSVEYLGGDVTINVNVVKNGHIDAPTAISSAEVATDGNPVSGYNFTANGDGTATAVVTFGENTTSGSRKADLTFSAGSPLAVSTTVTVMQDVNPALKKGWWLVTDVNDLVAGDKIIIAATGLDYAISTATNNTTRKSTAITKVGGALDAVSDSVQQYALEIDANGLYSFKGTLGSDKDKYIYASSSSSNYMKVSSTLDANGKFTVAINSDGAATVIAQGTNTRNHMQYNNKVNASPTFYCTDGSFGAVCFYKLYE